MVYGRYWPSLTSQSARQNNVKEEIMPQVGRFSQFAKAAGITRKQAWHWSNGGGISDRAAIHRASKYLGVTFADVVDSSKRPQLVSIMDSMFVKQIPDDDVRLMQHIDAGLLPGNISERVKQLMGTIKVSIRRNNVTGSQQTYKTAWTRKCQECGIVTTGLLCSVCYGTTKYGMAAYRQYRRVD